MVYQLDGRPRTTKIINPKGSRTTNQLMKHLRDYIIEELTTPTNTLGMGNPALPTETTTGSGDQLSFNLIKRVPYSKKHNKRTSKNEKVRKMSK